MSSPATKSRSDDDFATVTLFSGGFNNSPKVHGPQQTFSIRKPVAGLDAAKIAKARADSERVARLMGWN